MAVNRPVSYNKPRRRTALLEIRRLLVDEGLSHQEIQLRLNLPARTYFTYLDLLFKEEQTAICGNHYTYQRLLNETLLLSQRYLRHARMLTEIAQDKNVDAEFRIQAHLEASELERAAHDITYLSPAYLAAHKLLPESERLMNHPSLRMSKTHTFTQNQTEHEKETEKLMMRNAIEYRTQNVKLAEEQKQQQSA